MATKVNVQRQRTVIAYAELWHSSGVLFEMARARTDATRPLYLASAVFAAFAFEAFLNHVGPLVLPLSWVAVERKLSYEEKLLLLCERTGATIAWGEEPWQTVSSLFKRRNGVAHAKTRELEDEEMVRADSYQYLLSERLQEDWESLGSGDHVQRIRTQLQRAMERLHTTAGVEPPEDLFLRDNGSGSATLQIPLSAFFPAATQGSSDSDIDSTVTPG